MTAATSSKPVSFFGTRFRNNISNNKKQLIVNSVLQALGLPVLAIIVLIEMYCDELLNMNSEANQQLVYTLESACIPFAILSSVTISISLFLGIIIALSHFSYLYKKTITDMHYALPLNDTQRFFADYLSGLTIYMAPMIGATLLAIGILGAGTPFFKDMSEFWDEFPMMLRMLFIVLITMVLYYTLSVLAISFCGSIFEAIFSIIAFIGMIPATVACVWLALCESSSYGIQSSAILSKNIFTSTSPLGAVIFFFNDAVSSYDEYSSYYNSLFIKWIITTLIIIAIYLAAAYLLCRYRKAEDVSKPYVYKSFYYAIMAMSTFCVLSLFVSLGAFVGGGIVICAVGWFIMEVITRRGFKKFWQAGIGFTVSVISVLLVCQICKVTNGFGMSKKVPSSISVESIYIEGGLPTNNNALRFRDKDVINAAIELHKECVDRHFNSDNYTYQEISENDFNSPLLYDPYITLNYSTYTGSTIMRRYEVYSGMMGDLTKAILLSDEYAEYAQSQIFYYYAYEPWINIKNKVFSDVKKEYMTDEKLNDLRMAYSEDLMAMTEDDLLNAKVYCYINSIWVLESFENTISLLNSWDIKIDDVTKSDISSGRVGLIVDPIIPTRTKYAFEKKDDDISYHPSYGNYSSSYTIADSMTTIEAEYINENCFDLKRTSDEIMEIVDRCTPIVLGETPLAIVLVNDKAIYLLDRGNNKELLDKISFNSNKTKKDGSNVIGVDTESADSNSNKTDKKDEYNSNEVFIESADPNGWD